MENYSKNQIYTSKSVWGQVSHLASTLATKGETLETKRVIICEEQFTLTIEKALAKQLGGIMTTRVMSFGKICDTIKSKEKYLSKTCEIMLLSKLMAELSDDLELFSSATHMPSFAGAVYDILSLLSSSHVDFEKLEKENLPPALAKKIGDICKINKKYQSAKEGLFLDATDKMQALYQSFEKATVLQNADIYIVGHTAFTNQMMAVISKMINRGGVSIYLLQDMKSQIKVISEICQNSGKEFAVCQIKEDFPQITMGILNNIETDTPTEIPNLKLLQFSSKEYEIQNISLKIKHLLQEGVMPEDISLVLCDFQGYIDEILENFEKYNIPHFSAVTKTLESFPFPQHIISLAKLSTSNYSLDSVRSVLKSPFSPLPKEESYTFENFLISRNVDRGRFFKDEIFTKDTSLEKRNDFIAKTNFFQNPALSADEFSQICQEIANACLDVLTQIQCDVSTLGMIDNAEFLALSIKKTLEVAEEMKTVLACEIFTLEKLITIFQGGLCGKEISTIPPQLHAVEIIDASKSVISKKQYTYIVGCGKSTFPAYQKDTALLSDKDIFSLSNGGINVSPSVEFLNEKQDMLCKLSLLSGDNLSVSYSEMLGSVHETPSELFAILAKSNTPTRLESEYHFSLESLGVTLEDGYKSQETCVQISHHTICETVFSQKDAISLFSRELQKQTSIAKEISKSIYSAFQQIGESDILDQIAQTRHIEFASSTLCKKELSPTQLEQYFACPYSSFLSQNMRLSDKEVGILKEFDTGNFLHYLLEEFSQKMQNISESEISTEVAKISQNISASPAFAKFANQEKFQFVFSRLSREGEKICKHIYKSKEISNFQPTLHEFTFGGSKPVITPAGLPLRGKVDRVDIFGGDVVVIDYKTGHIDLSDSAFYHGLKLQSELYLYAVSKLQGKNPCGCLYLPISDDFKPTPPTYKMRGKLLASEEFLGNLDRTLENSGSSEIYPLAKTKTGNYKKSTSLLPEDSFAKHIADAVKTSEQGYFELSKGYIAPSPYLDSSKDACAYCKYKSICKTCGENSTRGGKLSEEE